MGIRPAGLGAVIGSPRPSRIGHLPVEILESKLFKPGIRPGVVPRPHLVAQLLAARAVPTVSVVAPAGYGKTTLLAQRDLALAVLTTDVGDGRRRGSVT